MGIFVLQKPELDLADSSVVIMPWNIMRWLLTAFTTPLTISVAVNDTNIAQYKPF